MDGKERARQRLQLRRANVRRRDVDIVSHSDWDWAMKRVGWVLGICFGVVFFIGVMFNC